MLPASYDDVLDAGGKGYFSNPVSRYHRHMSFAEFI
jgi:hypothetical protein